MVFAVHASIFNKTRAALIPRQDQPGVQYGDIVGSLGVVNPGSIGTFDIIGNPGTKEGSRNVSIY